MSAATQRVFAKERAGSRRAMPTTDSTSGSVARALRKLVPTLPDAPVTTTLTPGDFPGELTGKQPV